ncbi:ribonuclease H-like domain-containing protein [Tanacetum coccineum]
MWSDVRAIHNLSCKRKELLDKWMIYKAHDWKMSYLSDYEEIDGGYVAFGGDPKGGRNLVRGLPSNFFENDHTCVACQKGKQHKASCKTKTFYEMKGIKREVSVARTPQQNRVAERKNRTLIEAARTMLTDLKLPTTFWAEAVNTAYYVQNRVLVIKPHNKTPYEPFHGRTPSLIFMGTFGCPVIILNTLDHLGKFDGKADEGFFVGYPMNSKAFRVFNSRTRIVEETLHITFLENKPNVVGSGPSWLFNIDTLTKSMNYKPVVVGNQSIGSADSPFSSSSKDSPVVGFKPSGEEEKKDTKVPEKESGVSIYGCEDDPNMPNLEEIVYSDDDKDVGVEADMTNLDTHIPVSPIPTTRIHKDYPVEQIIGDIHSAPQTRRMTKHQVWTLVDLPYGKRAIGIKWIYRNKKDERVARIEAIRLFLAYASFRDFVVYQMDVKSAFLYGKIEEEVYVCQPPGFEDPEFPDRVYKVEKALYGLHQAPRACQDKYVDEILKKFGFSTVKTASTPMETSKPLLKDAKAKDVNDSPFDLEAYTDSDYAGASLDRKSTIGGCQFLGRRLISWQCKKQTIVANFTTEAEYVAASSCCGQAVTTAFSLEAERDSGNINRTQSMATLNKSFPEGTNSGSDLRYALTVNSTIYTSCIKQFWATAKVQTINEEVQIQALRKDSGPTEPIIDEATNEEHVSTPSYDSSQSEIATLKKRVKKLEKKRRSRTYKPRRLYKVSLSRRIESFDDVSLGAQEDASKQGRKIADLDADTEVTLIDETNITPRVFKSLTTSINH